MGGKKKTLKKRLSKPALTESPPDSEVDTELSRSELSIFEVEGAANRKITKLVNPSLIVKGKDKALSDSQLPFKKRKSRKSVASNIQIDMNHDRNARLKKIPGKVSLNGSNDNEPQSNGLSLDSTAISNLSVDTSVSKDTIDDLGGDRSLDSKLFTKVIFKNDDNPSLFLNCPKGMEELIKEDIIYLNPVYQFEGGMIATHVSASRFEVLNSLGYQIYYIGQKPNCCSRFIIYSKQSFRAVVYDMRGHKVFIVEGPRCFLHINLTAVKVTYPDGKIIGTIVTRRTCGGNYTINDVSGTPALEVKGQSCCPKSYHDFSLIRSKSNEVIGTISQTFKLAHLGQEFIDFETSGVSFHPGLDVQLKTLAMGALILIEFQWYNKHTKFSILVVFVTFIILAALILILMSPFLDDESEDGSVI